MSEIIRGLVSPSVRAAEKLPPTIKTQSVKNQLLRGGAKPIELEYAGLDTFLAGTKDRVSSEDVVRFLKERGPMGRVMRLDAQGATPDHYWGDEGEGYLAGSEPLEKSEQFRKLNVAERSYASLSDDQKAFTRDPLMRVDKITNEHRARMPSDPSTLVSSAHAWPYTMYDNWTEKNAHPEFSGRDYREIYWLDPATQNANKPFRQHTFNPLAPPLPVNAHETDAWVRYHINNDPKLGTVLDVQNIQSDIGQRLAKQASRKEMSESEGVLYDGYRDAADRTEASSDEAAKRIEMWLRHRGESIYPMVEQYKKEYYSRPATPFGPDGMRDAPRTFESFVSELAYRSTLGGTARSVLLQLPEESRAELLRLLVDKAKARKQAIAAAGNVARYTRQLQDRGLALPRDTWLDGVKPSVLFQNDNWIQLPARHLVSESAARGGAPIRLPLGVNVKAMENMPRAAATQMYQKNMVNTLRSILRPIGGAEVRQSPGTEMRQFEWSPHPDHEEELRAIRVGRDGQRAGTVVTPSQKAVEHINKHGLDFLSLLMLTGAGAAAQQEQKK